MMHARPLKLLVLSDLHVEFTQFDVMQNSQRIDRDADVVVLAGDIHVGGNGLRWARYYFPDKPIVYVAGNHEFYDGHWHQSLDSMRELAQVLDIHFLENDAVTIAGYRFLGATLWTDFALFGATARDEAMAIAQQRLVDYRAIETSEPDPAGLPRPRKLLPVDTLERHQASLAWLEGQLLDQKDKRYQFGFPPARTVVVTHHYPSFRSTLPQFQQDLTSAAFGSNLEYLMGKAALWIHGHTHGSFDYEICGTRVICNPRGYPNRRTGGFENPAFDACKMVEVRS